MHGQIKDEKKKDVSVTLRSSDNGGFIVDCSWQEESHKSEDDECCNMSSSYKHKTYVYETLDSAVEAIKPLISLHQDMDESDDIDRKMMKKGEY